MEMMEEGKLVGEVKVKEPKCAAEAGLSILAGWVR